MKPRQHNNISESQIEEAFVTDLTLLGKALNLRQPVKLIARQLRLKSGAERLDILISHGRELCLLELKVTSYADEHLDQILEYKLELENLQVRNELIAGKINAYLLLTGATQQQVRQSKEREVEIIIYKPIDVLTSYYKSLSSTAPFLRIKPNDYGVFSLGLINRTLIELRRGKTTTEEIARAINLSKGSVHNHLKVAGEFGLVRERGAKYFLTDHGDEFVAHIDTGILANQLTSVQAELLKQFIAQDPFYSSSVFGIYSIVESAFMLARNSYPIQLVELRKMFRIISGKVTEWQSEKSLSTATYTFLNFAVGLELLGKIGAQIVITPAGFRFILMLQLHKSIEMIESLSTDVSYGSSH